MPLQLRLHRLLGSICRPSSSCGVVYYCSSKGLSLSSPSHSSSRWIPPVLIYSRRIHDHTASKPNGCLPTASIVSIPESTLDQHAVKRRTRALQKSNPNHEVLFLAKSQSDVLNDALEESGYSFAVPPKIEGKADLSKVSPFSSKRKRKASKSHRRMTKVDKTFSLKNPLSLSLQHILAHYMRRIDPLLSVNQRQPPKSCDQPTLDHAVSEVFNDATVDFLHSKGYEVSDVVVWIWILTARASEQAALRLLVISNTYLEGQSTATKTVPIFVFLFLLRRRKITARALRYLIIHAWSRLRHGQDPPLSMHSPMDKALIGIDCTNLQKSSIEPGTTHHMMSEPTIMTMVVRLLRHARLVWPASINNIALMVTKYVDGSSPESPNAGKLSRLVSIRLNMIYNRVLSLLSIPSCEHPFRSVPYHQQAQMRILRRMHEFEPALLIAREGYRAVIRVQLAHRKTHQEREWAELKAKSWPPWKENKLGIDVDKGVGLGISRAKEAMARFKEAGYGGRAFEDAANIFSGWDTDQSPTIQTRTQMPRHLRGHRSHSSDTDLGDSSVVWAARIISTRTVDEAWACFLAYKEDGLPPLQEVYYAMFQKLVFDMKRLKRVNNEGEKARKQLLGMTEDKISMRSSVVPGDGREVLSPPSPREAIYVRTPAPDVSVLFRTMLGDGIKPSGRLLAFLLINAESFDAGIDYLRSSSLPPHVVRILVDENEPDYSDIQQSLELLPDYFFAAYLRFLTHSRSWKLATDSQVLLAFGPTIPIAAGIQRNITSPYQTFLQTPARQAFRLISIMKPYYRPPWNTLFAALARRGTRGNTNDHSDDTDINEILNWKLALELLHQMKGIRLEPDFQQFQLMCVCLEKALWASHRVLARKAQSPISIQDEFNFFGTQVDSLKHLKLEAQLVLDNGLAQLKAIFRQKTSWGLGLDGEEAYSETVNSTLKKAESTAPKLLLPRLLDVPSPAELHPFIRVLGLCKDYEGMHDLVRWMVDFAPELKSIADEVQSGSRSMRRLLVAVRVFLEQSWMYYGSAEDFEESKEQDVKDDDDDDVLPETYRGASEITLHKFYEAIESVEHWGGWPDDKEVEAYCQRGRFL